MSISGCSELMRAEIQISSEPIPSEEVIKKIASIKGPIDLYCWFEGTQGLSKNGASFMKEALFTPLYDAKKDARICLYSLIGWDFSQDLAAMAPTSKLVDAINRINNLAFQALSASSFFSYCADVSSDGALYKYLSEELPKKEWLTKLSEGYKEKGKTITDLFGKKKSLFDCIGKMDVKRAYSFMQYVEGYYLVQRSVRKGLAEGKKAIQIGFVLPNDESKYYKDFPKDIQKMLCLDFGDALKGIQVSVNILTFKYGNLNSRPYIDKGAEKIKPADMLSYFDFLSKKPSINSLNEESYEKKNMYDS